MKWAYCAFFVFSTISSGDWKRLLSRRALYFTISKGIRRPAVVYFDDLHNAKKPPAWMQDILFHNSTEDEQEKGA